MHVRLYDELHDREWTVDSTPRLADIFAYAHAWGLAEKRPDHCTLTFRSMLAAMFSGSDPLCEWLRRHLRLRGCVDPLVTKGRSLAAQPMPAERLPTSQSYRDAESVVRELAHGRPLDVRHFVAAFPIVQHYHREDFLRLRIDRRAWCIDLADILRARYPAEAEQWEAYAAKAPPVMVPGFDADLPAGADLLGIGREVEAFAMLVAGRRTLTPLAIGVFGAWGSGKSYFMARLEQRVTALATAATRRHHSLGNIAQVRFNAWQYSESNVIASLVNTIFRNLRFRPGESEAELADRRDSALAEIRVADTVMRERQTELARAECTAKVSRERLAAVTREVDQALRTKETELRVAHDAASRAAEDLETLDEQQQRALEASNRRAPLEEAVAIVTRTCLDDPKLKQLAQEVEQTSSETRWVGLNAGNIVIGATVLGFTAAAVEILPLFRDSKALAWATGFIVAIAPIVGRWLTVLRALADKGREFKDAVASRREQALQRLRAAGRDEREQRERQLAERRQTLERLRTQIDDLRTRSAAAGKTLAVHNARRTQADVNLLAAIQDLAEKRRRLDELTSGSLLSELLDDLGKTDVYAEQLSLLSRAHDSFKQLSERIAAARKESATDSAKTPALERIVLYIDDLDRCPSDKVREVLQAVHLLLAFDLFVCVVAVDPRWVHQCLARSPGLVAPGGIPDSELHSLGGAATPSDYLEKVFQIPLWLRPVPQTQRTAMIGAYFQRHLVERQGGAAEANVPATAGDRACIGLLAQREPARIRIDASELQFLPRIAPLLDGNPRALKRFVNTYLLVKASISDVELDYFLESQAYRVCMTQLAVLATQRQRARMLVRHADGAFKREDRNLTFAEWLEELEESDDETARLLAEDLRSSLSPELDQVSMRHFAVWLERTRRYSFYL